MMHCKRKKHTLPVCIKSTPKIRKFRLLSKSQLLSLSTQISFSANMYTHVAISIILNLIKQLYVAGATAHTDLTGVSHTHRHTHFYHIDGSLPTYRVCVGLGAVADQLNQTEMAVLLNLLQGQTERLTLPQMAEQLLASSSSSSSLPVPDSASDADSSQQLELLSHTLSSLIQASNSAPAPPPPPPPEAPQPEAPPPEAPPSDDTTGLLALLLSQLIKAPPQGVGQGEESNGVQSDGPVTRSGSASLTGADCKGKSEFTL